MNKHTIHIAITALLVCTAGIATAANISVRLGTPKKRYEKTTCHYEYSGTVSYSPERGKPSDVTLEAYFLFHDNDDESDKRGTVDVVGGQPIGTFSFDAKSPKMQKFNFSSTRLEKDLANQLKGVIVRAVANGQFLTAACYPARKVWVDAARELTLPSANSNLADDNENAPAASSQDSPSAISSTDPEYAEKTGSVSTNIFLNTEWAFNQGECGSPKALINDQVKCPHHATTHIIDYNVVSKDGMSVYANTLGCVDFTMSIRDSRSMTAKCKFRCWDKKFRSFDLAPEGHRASVSGRMSTSARFRISIDTKTGEWKLSARSGYTPSGIKIDAKGNVKRGK